MSRPVAAGVTSLALAGGATCCALARSVTVVARTREAAHAFMSLVPWVGRRLVQLHHVVRFPCLVVELGAGPVQAQRHEERAAADGLDPVGVLGGRAPRSTAVHHSSEGLGAASQAAVPRGGGPHWIRTSNFHAVNMALYRLS